MTETMAKERKKIRLKLGKISIPTERAFHGHVFNLSRFQTLIAEPDSKTW